MRRTKRQSPEAEGRLLPEACSFGLACAGDAPVNRAFKGRCIAMSCTAEGSLKLKRIARSLRSRCAATFGKAPGALSEEDGGRGLEALRHPGQPAPVPAPIGRFLSCAFCTEQLRVQGR